MPCNKSAVRRERLTAEQLAQMLTTKALLPVLQKYFEAKIEEIGDRLPDRTIELRENSAEQLTFRLGGYYGIDIFIKAGGIVEISHTYQEQARLDQTILDDMQIIMTSIGLNLFREEVTRFAQTNLEVTETFTRPDGTYVINFNY